MNILNAFEEWKKQNLPEKYKKEQLEKLWNELLKEKTEVVMKDWTGNKRTTFASLIKWFG